MKVLVIGSGGREHTLVWKLKKSKKVSKIFCAPGNAGIAQLAKCIDIKPGDIRQLVDFASRNKIGLTVVGPEVPLAAGIVDEFQKHRLKIFGPDKKAAQLEASKMFAKTFMRKHHIPTAAFRAFSIAAEAIGFCKSVEFPVVIKADGLAAGKGVSVVHDIKQATAAIESIMVAKQLGKAGDTVIVESCLTGQEVSIMCLTDGKTILPMLSSQDHKQAYDGDRGPNTGGMGAYCPTTLVDADMMEQISDYVLNPVIKGLHKEGITYRGVLYAGLMITETGPKVLEFNCRFGDPETQVVLPLLKNDLFDLMMATINQKLGSVNHLDWKPDSAACVVMASKGYPGRYHTGRNITGLQNVTDNNCVVFHAGTVQKGNQCLTAGGRVLNVVGIDRSLQAALNRSYKAVSKIRFDGAMFRRDIGGRVLKQKEK